MRNLGAQLAAIQDCIISRGKAGFPLEMLNFIGEATQPTIGPSPSEQPMRGVHQAMIIRLPLCKKNTESCELDEERLQNKAKTKFWRVFIATTTHTYIHKSYSLLNEPPISYPHISNTQSPMHSLQSYTPLRYLKIFKL